MTSSPLLPDAVEWLGVQYRTLCGGPGAPVSIVESVSPPSSGPPRHVHAAEDESFVVLSGDVEFWVEGEAKILGPGQATTVVRGQEHTFRVTAEKPARTLIILTPGGFEGFFTEMAEARCRIPEDMEQVTESATRHNLTFTGPPL